MTIAVLDIDGGQAAVRGPTGVLDRPGLYIWDEERDTEVRMHWTDALRMALWILMVSERLDLGARMDTTGDCVRIVETWKGKEQVMETWEGRE